MRRYRVESSPAAPMSNEWVPLAWPRPVQEKRGHDTQFTAAQDSEASQLLSARPFDTPRLAHG
jgi:hypothetical protein